MKRLSPFRPSLLACVIALAPLDALAAFGGALPLGAEIHIARQLSHDQHVEARRDIRAQGREVLKPAKLATGFEIGVPIFVAQGDKVEIDTRTGEYRKRV